MKAQNTTVMLFVSMILFVPMALLSAQPEPEPAPECHLIYLPFVPGPWEWDQTIQGVASNESDLCPWLEKPPIPIPPAEEPIPQPTNPNTCYYDDGIWTCCDYEDDARDCEPEHEIPACQPHEEVCGDCVGGTFIINPDMPGGYEYLSWTCVDDEVPVNGDDNE